MSIILLSQPFITIEVHIERDLSKGIVNNKLTDWSFKMDGVLHNASQDSMEEHSSQYITARISYLEIHNEVISDLLPSLPLGSESDLPLSIVESPHGVSVRGLSIHPAPNEEIALNFLFECHSRILSNARYVTSKINLVDLAATYINKSLSFLEQVVIALSDCSRDHVPFRQSKLTYTLKDSLVSPLTSWKRMKWVTTQPVVNEKIDSERMVKNLEKEVLYLKEELAMHNSLLNRPTVTYEPLNDIQITEINSQVRRFLEGTIDELDANVVAFSQQDQEVEARLRSKYALIDKNDFATLSAIQKAGIVDAEGHLVGEMDGQGFGIGTAPFSSKPGKKMKAKKGKEQTSTTTRKEGLGSPFSGKDLETLSVSRSQVVAAAKELEGRDGLFRDQEVSSLDTHRSDSAPRDDSSIRPR
ncbi:hypothetical protein E2320_001432 [Naja naja]|nr:hypothetical protein E2320_001432 [Naja naja]